MFCSKEANAELVQSYFTFLHFFFHVIVSLGLHHMPCSYHSWGIIVNIFFCKFEERLIQSSWHPSIDFTRDVQLDKSWACMYDLMCMQLFQNSGKEVLGEIVQCQLRIASSAWNCRHRYPVCHCRNHWCHTAC